MNILNQLSKGTTKLPNHDFIMQSLCLSPTRETIDTIIGNNLYVSSDQLQQLVNDDTITNYCKTTDKITIDIYNHCSKYVYNLIVNKKEQEIIDFLNKCEDVKTFLRILYNDKPLTHYIYTTYLWKVIDTFLEDFDLEYKINKPENDMMQLVLKEPVHPYYLGKQVISFSNKGQLNLT